MLGFDDDFELTDLTSKLEDNGFEAFEIDGGDFYELEDPDSPLEESPTTELAIRTVGVLDEENVAIVGTDQETAELRGGEDGSLADSEATESIADRFEDYASVALAPGEPCSQPALGPGTTPQIAEQLEDLRGNPYETLALGYRVEGEGESTAPSRCTIRMRPVPRRT